MKTLYLSLLAVFILTNTTNAQLTLLPANHEPLANEKDGYKLYDSTGAVPKATGANLNWDFSAMTMRSGAAKTETFMATTSVPSASMFTSANLAGTWDNATHHFYKSSSSPSQFEMVGTHNSTTSMNLTNGKVIYAWPISFGVAYSDTYAGTQTGTMYKNISGTTSVVASGNGTIILPGSAMYTNVLQVKTTDMMMIADTNVAVPTGTVRTTMYQYFHKDQKFPLVTVYYSMTDTLNTTRVAEIRVNHLVAVGINDYNLDASFAIYPNPAKDQFSVKLSNVTSDDCVVKIYNSLGELVKTNNLGNSPEIAANISITDLKTGIYIVNTTIGNRSSARKLIVE